MSSNLSYHLHQGTQRPLSTKKLKLCKEELNLKKVKISTAQSDATKTLKRPKKTKMQFFIHKKFIGGELINFLGTCVLSFNKGSSVVDDFLGIATELR